MNEGSARPTVVGHGSVLSGGAEYMVATSDRDFLKDDLRSRRFFPIQRELDTSFWLGAESNTSRFDAAIEDCRNAAKGVTFGKKSMVDVDPAKERQWIDMAESAGIISEKDAWMRRLGLPSVDRWGAELQPPVEERPAQRQQHYVAGFLFSEDRGFVALIEKQKPAWQVGKINGIGGKIELNETPSGAMAREFVEEAGLWISNWEPVAVLTGEDFVVHFFAAFSDRVFYVKSMEGERVGIYNLSTLLPEGLYNQPALMPNLRTLIPLALDTSGITKPVQLFDGIAEASQQRGKEQAS